MKLFTTNTNNRHQQAPRLLIEGEVEEIVTFINGVNDGHYVGKVDRDDLEENGGNWGSPPDGWAEDRPYYFATPTQYRGGFESLKDALVGLVGNREDCLLK